MLGISLYPDKTVHEDDVRYLERARSFGFSTVFMSLLQVRPGDSEASLDRLRQCIRACHEHGFKVTLDINPMVFDYLPASPDDLSFFNEMGVDVLRMDGGMNGRLEAQMTHNPYGIGIEFNMSNNNAMLDMVYCYAPDPSRISGSCNFYPQRYTGMRLDDFVTVCQKYRQRHLPGAVFITSQHAEISPWPVCEGNCTLEIHRDLPLWLQARHLKMMNLVDTWIIGNAYASDDELESVAREYGRALPVLEVQLADGVTDFEREVVFGLTQRYRGDASGYMVRSIEGRRRYFCHELPAHLNAPIKRGDVLVLNHDYGQYSAELQLALVDRPADPRVNVVGHIVPEQLLLLDQLVPYQEFKLEEAVTC